jgi:hypothetical protein
VAAKNSFNFDAIEIVQYRGGFLHLLRYPSTNRGEVCAQQLTSHRKIMRNPEQISAFPRERPSKSANEAKRSLYAVEASLSPRERVLKSLDLASAAEHPALRR